jgi:hypothetical protein
MDHAIGIGRTNVDCLKANLVPEGKLFKGMSKLRETSSGTAAGPTPTL